MCREWFLLLFGQHLVNLAIPHALNRPLKHCSLTIVVTIFTFKCLRQICTFHASDPWMFIENSVKIIHSYQIFFLLVLKLLQPDNSNKRYREWKQCLIYYIFKENPCKYYYTLLIIDWWLEQLNNGSFSGLYKSTYIAFILLN